jgi:hypothetical protein
MSSSRTTSMSYIDQTCEIEEQLIDEEEEVDSKIEEIVS